MNAGRYLTGEKAKPHAGGRGVSVSADTWAGGGEGHATPETFAPLSLALAAVDAARATLDRYALATDSPAWGAVEAADLLDASRVALADAMTGGTRHDAA